MTQSSVVVHLIGFPGAGKLTIAQQMSRLRSEEGQHFVVIDNHLINNPILATLDPDDFTEIPSAAWVLVREVRAAVYRSIEELSPPDWSFIFTNVLSQNDPADRLVAERVRLLANRRCSQYIPVRISCDTEELLRRVAGAGRRERFKWVDANLVQAYIESRSLLAVETQSALDLDVTMLSSVCAAKRVLWHIDQQVDQPVDHQCS